MKWVINLKLRFSTLKCSNICTSKCIVVLIHDFLGKKEFSPFMLKALYPDIVYTERTSTEPWEEMIAEFRVWIKSVPSEKKKDKYTE